MLSQTVREQVYGEASVGSEVGLHEHSTLEPTNPYSAAKAGAEMMVRFPASLCTPVAATCTHSVLHVACHVHMRLVVERLRLRQLRTIQACSACPGSLAE